MSKGAPKKRAPVRSRSLCALVAALGWLALHRRCLQACVETAATATLWQAGGPLFIFVRLLRELGRAV